MEDQNLFNSEEINEEQISCSPNCDDNCKIKNIAFLQYQYRPTDTAGSTSIDKSAKSGVASICLEHDRDADFKMFKIATKEATEPEDVIEYKVGVTNTGDVPLTNVRLVDVLDANTTYVNGSGNVVRAVSGVDTTVPSTVTYTDANKTLIIVANQALPVGETFIFSYRVSVSGNLTNQNITNNATVTTTEEPTPQNDFVVIPSRFARVTINKAVSPESTRCVRCGDDLTYRITLTHSGTIPATNLVVTDLFDPEFCFDARDVVVRNRAGQIVGAPAVTVTVNNGLLTVNIATLPVNEIYTITVSGEICCCEDDED